MTDRTAGCLCGAVRLRISDMPSGFGACHCEMCRRWTGAAFLAVETPAAGVTVERGADRIARYQSSGWAERAWCGTCGSHLWYRVTRAGHAGAGCHEIPLGLLDDPSGRDLLFMATGTGVAPFKSMIDYCFEQGW
ncbi:MAG: GFA family protein, partial [Paracoccaceae bacterium]